jgi:hypothetical protein
VIEVVNDGLRWHDKHTMFYDDWFMHSNNIKLIASYILEAAVLVFRMEKTCKICQ